MKLLLVFLNNEYRPMVPVNLTALEGFVKRHGHEVKVFDTSFYADVLNVENTKRNIEAGSYFGVDYSRYGISIKEEASSADLVEMVGDFKPDLIGFGVYSYTESKADELAKAVKKEFKTIPILYGGIHPTLKPAETLSKEWVDMICVGEGEKALLDVCNSIEQGKEIENILNIWIKRDRKIIRNTLRPFIDLNEIPTPDWSSYEEYQHYGPIEGHIYKLGMVEFSRGCPYSCSYCEGPLIRKIYSEAGIKGFVRPKAPQKFVDDCAHLVKTYGIEFFYFVDGTFLTMSDSILEELAHLYKLRVNRPFLCLTTVPSLTEKRVRLLKEMGCYQVNAGIESGNQKYRKEILNRPNMSDDAIVNAFKMLRKYKIRSSAYNMIGLPWQDRADVFDTIELNRRCNPTRTNVSIFIPFPNTPLTERLRKEGYITSDTPLGDETSATVNVPSSMSIDEISGLYRTFNLYCKVPKKLFPLLKACEVDNETSQFVIEKLRDIYLPRQ